ncbi:sensor histidine kinase [Micromonospora sp. CPCC 205558]|uniref:sensor histidine kinase n=1 Tax=Micromonospora sp. CPCC 205558 TaxID=3122403 RepID=UPI002FF3A328
MRILDSAPPGWPHRRRRLLLDVLLWAAVAAPVGYAGVSPPYPPYALPLLVGKLLLLGVAVVASRRLPLVALVLVVLGSLLDGNFVFAIPVFSYLAGRRSASVGSAVGVFVLIAAGGTALNLGMLGTGAATWFLLASVLLFAAVFPWLVGRYRRQQQELAEAGRRHVDALTREQRGAAERIRLRERARIAHEMHDSLGHDLSLIALRAGALEVAADLDDRHRAAAAELRASVSSATERLHEIIGVLREEGGASLRPSGETVADLVVGAREAGMAVRLAAAPAVAELPAMTGHAAHRIVREALTNAARYAPGAAVDVRLTLDGDRVEVTVVNDAPSAAPLPAPPSQGSGLLALAERVRLAGGTLDADHRAGGGFAVRAVLPATAPPPAAIGSAAEAELAPWPERTGPVRRPTDAERRLHDARRRVRRSLLVALVAPVGFALVLSLVYYPVATAGTVLDRATFDQMRVGAARSELVGLPRRQLERPAAVDRAGCEYYTDGNFPLAEPTWRLCFTDGRLVSKEWIA